MPTEQQIDAAAAAAAEKANGGKFSDPLFYKPEQRAFWREVVRTALEAADAARSAKKEAVSVSKQDVANFSNHCVYIRSVWSFATSIWRDSAEEERKTMESIAPLFFEDFAQVLSEYVVMAACRVTDPATDRQNNENFTVEMFVESFSSDPETYKRLDELHQRMKKLRKKIEPARHKLVAHADRETIRSGKPLDGASWQEWDDFWTALADFVRVLNEKVVGEPFEIDAGGVLGDAQSFMKAFRQSKCFEALANGDNPVVRDACLDLILPKA